MEEQNLFKKICSTYIYNIINSYIKPSSNFIYNLIAHSKSEQKRLKINLFNYQELYYSKRIDLTKFSDDKDFPNLIKNIFNREDEELTKKLIINYFQENKPNIYENSLIIRLEIPFCDELLKTNNLIEQYFDITIPILEIRENNSLELYRNKFAELNKSNSKYTSIYLQLGNSFDINTLKLLKIKFNQITKLKIEFFNFRFHYDPFLSINDLRNSLVYLSLNNKEVNYRYGLYPPNSETEKNYSIFQKINELTSLKYLKLSELDCGDFVLKLSHLKKILLKNVKNIIFDVNTFSELKTLVLDMCYDISSKSLIKCPEMKECYFYDDGVYGYEEYNSLLDFSSLTKLEKFYGRWKNFLLLENTSLKELTLKDYYKYKKKQDSFLFENELKIDIPSEEDEKKIFEKICTIKTLKSIDFGTYDGNSFSKIKMENKSVSKIIIDLDNNNLVHLQRLFPNLTDLTINNSYFLNNNNQLEIKESIESKIKKVHLPLYIKGNINLLCTSFKKLEEIDFNLNNSENLHIEKCFPIFNNNCNIIFDYLKIFRLRGYINNDLIRTIYNNISNVPNLEEFKLACSCEEKIDKNLYKDFIEKILHLKFIKKVEIGKFIGFKEYTIEELKILFPDVNFNAFFEIIIYKH